MLWFRVVLQGELNNMEHTAANSQRQVISTRSFRVYFIKMSYCPITNLVAQVEICNGFTMFI